jgi:oligoribonuclease (3'-5' exoribonuclease)
VSLAAKGHPPPRRFGKKVEKSMPEWGILHHPKSGLASHQKSSKSRTEQNKLFAAFLDHILKTCL